MSGILPLKSLQYRRGPEGGGISYPVSKRAVLLVSRPCVRIHTPCMKGRCRLPPYLCRLIHSTQTTEGQGSRCTDPRPRYRAPFLLPRVLPGVADRTIVVTPLYPRPPSGPAVFRPDGCQPSTCTFGFRKLPGPSPRASSIDSPSALVSRPEARSTQTRLHAGRLAALARRAAAET